MSFDKADYAAQRWLVENDVLPKTVQHWPVKTSTGYELTEAPLEKLAEEWNMQIGPEERDIFRRCRLPHGWGKVPSLKSPYWTRIVDPGKHERARIFYRPPSIVSGTGTMHEGAVLILSRRFSISYEQENPKAQLPHTRIRPIIRYDTRVAWTGEWYELGEEKFWFAIEQIENIARRVLDKAYPDWHNPLAYWYYVNTEKRVEKPKNRWGRKNENHDLGA